MIPYMIASNAQAKTKKGHMVFLAWTARNILFSGVFSWPGVLYLVIKEYYVCIWIKVYGNLCSILFVSNIMFDILFLLCSFYIYMSHIIENPRTDMQLSFSIHHISFAIFFHEMSHAIFSHQNIMAGFTSYLKEFMWSWPKIDYPLTNNVLFEHNM